MKRIVALLALLCLLLPVFAVGAEVYVKKTPPEDWQERDLLRITVFRTGEGDCMLVQCGGESMMIDGGPYKYREKLRDALAERGVSHFKYLFNTHPHDDHIEGLRMLMQYGLEADEFVSVFPKDKSDKEGNQKKAMEVLDKAGIPYRQLSSGDVLTLGDAEITVYNWPEGETINAQSAMARLVYQDCSALFTADIIGETQKYFLETLGEEALKADVLKAPHHGLKAFVPEFLTAVDPAFVWINNYHGSAVSSIEGQLERRKLPMMYSGDGTVVLECDGTDWYVIQNLYQF